MNKFSTKFKEKPAPPRVGSFSEIEGDLIKLAKSGNFDYIGHGANCFSMMDAGIAKQIALNFPKADWADKFSTLSPIDRLGTFTKSKESEGFTVFNFYTQYYLGAEFDLEALKLCLRKMNIFHSESASKKWRVGLPLIGCGIGGGEWEEVKAAIQKELSQFDVTIVHFPAPKTKPLNRFQ